MECRFSACQLVFGHLIVHKLCGACKQVQAGSSSCTHTRDVPRANAPERRGSLFSFSECPALPLPLPLHCSACICTTSILHPPLCFDCRVLSTSLTPRPSGTQRATRPVLLDLFRQCCKCCHKFAIRCSFCDTDEEPDICMFFVILDVFLKYCLVLTQYYLLVMFSSASLMSGFRS